MALYEDLMKSCQKLFDDYFWLNDEKLQRINKLIRSINETAGLVLDEFEKVQSIQQQAREAVSKAILEQKKILGEILPESWSKLEQFVEGLNRLKHQRGHLLTISELRYMDKETIAELDKALEASLDKLSHNTVEFLARPDALETYISEVNELEGAVGAMEKVTDLQPIIERLENISQGLDLLTEILSSLQIDDATLRTRILESIAEVYAHLNQIKARAGHRRKELASGEAVAQFSARFKLFNQSITSALGLCDTPERCDEQLSRLLLQLEELESQFSEFDEFLTDIISKRDEIYEAFEARKQNLLEERQRRSQNIFSAAQRIIDGIGRKTAKITEQDELNTYFSSDAMVLKCYQLVDQLRDVGDAVKADDVEAKLKAAKEQAIRSLRDKSDIYEGGGNIIKLGKHKFSVNTQVLDLTILPKDDQLMFHLIGTDYFEPVHNPTLEKPRPYWQLSNESETEQVYRAEYLASLILRDAQRQKNDLSINGLVEAIRKDELDEVVRRYAAPRYKEGYEKGIHDHDAAKILRALIPVYRNGDLLRFSPRVRAIAIIYY